MTVYEKWVRKVKYVLWIKKDIKDIFACFLVKEKKESNFVIE